ncbi:MAG: ATPase [Deltaproteobacteria bacterium]|nr:MAG: ATPase [Deltaproteobacteria bacterium]
MKASEIAKALVSLTSIQQPVFLWGPPGIGKSQVVQQTALSLDLEIIDVRAILLDPVDLRGIPRITSQGISQWCAPGFLPQKGKGILFLDELNAAPPLVQAACYQLVLDRCIGEYVLPQDWSVVAAGNRDQDRAVTHRMPSALANRFVHLEFAVDTDDWLTWAAGNEILPEVIAFIRFRPNLLHDFDPEKDDRAFPSPRSWEFVSRIMKSKPDPTLLGELVRGTVGPGASAEFMGFLSVWQQLPQAREILDNPSGIEIPADPAILFALCEMMGRAAHESVAEPLMIWASRLPPEFSVLLVREAVRHNNTLVNTQAFAQWAKQHADVLI